MNDLKLRAVPHGIVIEMQGRVRLDHALYYVIVAVLVESVATFR